MAKLLDKSNIITGQPVEAWNVSQSIDAFTAIDDYSIKISGSLDVTGSIEVTATVSASRIEFGDGTTQSTAATSGETYDLNATQDGSNVDLNLTSTSGGDDSVVQLTAGSNITLTRNSATEVTIAGNAGTVTSVTGTAPVVSSGGTTPAISMAAATTSVNGYLTSTDWNTFDDKIGGGIISGQVAYGDTTADTIKGEAAFSYDEGTDTLTAGTFSGQYEGKIGINPATPDSAFRAPLKLLVGAATLSAGSVTVRSFQSDIQSNTLAQDLFVTVCALGPPQPGVDITCVSLNAGVLEFASAGGSGTETIMFHIWYTNA